MQQSPKPNAPTSSGNSNPWQARVSAFASATDTRPSRMTLLQAVQYATGKSQKGVVLAIRKARAVAAERAAAQGLDGKARDQLLKKSTENLKRGLWGFTPTGTYNGGRKADQAGERTEAVMVEADHLGSPEAARAAVRAAARDPAVMAAWVSPSGDGLKVLVWVQGGADHATRHAFATDCIFGVGGVLDNVKDDACYRNEHLLCFGSYDPNAHVRTKDLAPLQVPVDYAEPGAHSDDGEGGAARKAGGAAPVSEGDALDVAELVGVLKHIPPDCRRNPDLTERKEGEARDQWLRIGMAIHDQIPNRAGRDLWDKWSRGEYGVAKMLGEVPDNYDSAALRTSWKSFSEQDGGVSWATAVQLGRQWEKADAARGARAKLADKTSKGPDATEPEMELGTNPDALEVTHYLVEAFFTQPHVQVKGNGEMVERGGAVLANPAKRIAVEIRKKFKMNIGTSTVQDAVEVRQTELAFRRRSALKAKIVGAKHGTEEGKAEVRRWLTAVTGKVDPLDEAVLLHILRNIKLKMRGRPAADHKALILYALQRSGKSTAVRKLLQPLEELTYWAHSLKTMVDERGVRRWGVYAAIVWDEMAGSRSREADEHIDTLKALATGDDVTWRRMGTNTDGALENTATLFGTTNRPVADIIQDATGNRRFWQMETLPQIDWATINAIDYGVLWTAIGIKDKSPLAEKAVDKAVMDRHHATRHKDVVEQWMEAETWAPMRDVLVPGTRALVDIGRVRGGRWHSTHELYARFCAWCAANGVRQASAVWFGRQLSALGWEAGRQMVKGARLYGYTAPIYL